MSYSEAFNPNYQLSEERRSYVGAHVISIFVMQELASFLAEHPEAARSDKCNTYSDHACWYMHLLGEKEFPLARAELKTLMPSSIQNVTFEKMGLAQYARTLGGRSTVLANGDFIVATHYLESTEQQEKIDAEIGLSQLLGEREDVQMYVDFYATRALANISTIGIDCTDVPQTVFRTAYDSEFWLGTNLQPSQPSQMP